LLNAYSCLLPVLFREGVVFQEGLGIARTEKNQPNLLKQRIRTEKLLNRLGGHLRRFMQRITIYASRDRRESDRS
jgi:hypothetical protein